MITGHPLQLLLLLRLRLRLLLLLLLLLRLRLHLRLRLRLTSPLPSSCNAVPHGIKYSYGLNFLSAGASARTSGGM